MENQIYTGVKIKNIREEKGLTLSVLSEKSGVDTEVLKTIEDSKVLPFVEPLIKIARALDVRLGTFLEEHEQSGPVVTTQGQVKLSLNMGSATSKRKDMHYYSLTRPKAGRRMESFEILFEPSADSDFVLSSHEGEEFLYVLEGVVEINYGEESYLLNSGDSIYYDSIVSHHVHCASDHTAKILAVIYTPE